MAVTTIDSGTQTATGTHALVTETSEGIYVCQWNLTNMANGDIIECYVTTKTLTGDTAEIIYYGHYRHSQGDAPMVTSPPFVSMFSLTMYVAEGGSSSISVPWALIKL